MVSVFITESKHSIKSQIQRAERSGVFSENPIIFQSFRELHISSLKPWKTSIKYMTVTQEVKRVRTNQKVGGSNPAVRMSKCLWASYWAISQGMSRNTVKLHKCSCLSQFRWTTDYKQLISGCCEIQKPYQTLKHFPDFPDLVFKRLVVLIQLV